MNPLVSIIIPVYNVEEYLDECLNSVIKQTYSNIEIIIVDDGSTDRSKDIIKIYKKNDHRIKFFSINNSGQGKARNIGINNSLGEYIYFLDSDDFIEAQTIDILVKSIHNNHICVYNAISFIHESGKIVSSKYFEINHDDLINEIKKGNHIKYLAGCISPCLKLYSAEFIKKHTIYFPEGIFGEDVEFWLRCITNTTQINYIEYNGYHRRYRKNSTMTGGSIKNIKDRIYSMDRLLNITPHSNQLRCFILQYLLDIWGQAYKKKNQDLVKYAQFKFSEYDVDKLCKDINILYKIRYNLFKKPLLNNHMIILYLDRLLINLIKFCNLFSSNDK
jgi:glycosyltransferase involved in cell wall biosynthesis